MTVTMLVPLPEEDAELRNGLARLGHVPVPHKVGRLMGHRFPDLGLDLFVGGHGKTQFGVQTQYLLAHDRTVDIVICAGAAGSLVDGLGVGDIVVGEETVEHDYRLRFVQRPLPRFPGDDTTLRRLKTHGMPSLSFGTIASGDEDVVDTERANEIAMATGALCVAWEGAGAARACTFNDVPFVEIRCVTDQADKSAPHDFSHNLGLAMSKLAILLDGWLWEPV